MNARTCRSLALLSLLAAMACGPGTAPAGQSAMVPLSSETLAGLRDEFNKAKAEVKVILLLSPT
jgi:hypothetical protein